MFFPLSKILGFFAIPSNLVISIGVIGLLLLPTRFARAGRTLVFASLIVLAVLGLSPLGNALIIPLEERFPRWDAAHGSPDGIIVLGGAVSPDVSAARDEVALNEAAERLTIAAKLARRYPDARILLSGGSAALRKAQRRRSPCGSCKTSGSRAHESYWRTDRATRSRMRFFPSPSRNPSRASAGCW
jgi:uncharacterized SAM-binding protein YcdF (DUF218 family)